MNNFVEIYKTENDEFAWRRKAENGQIVANSAETYRHHQWAERSAHVLNKDVPDENFHDLTK